MDKQNEGKGAAEKGYERLMNIGGKKLDKRDGMEGEKECGGEEKKKVTGKEKHIK